MQTETLTYEADGLQMVSHFYYDKQTDGRRPGVLVLPEAFGLGGHAKARGFLEDFGVVHRADRRVVGRGSSSYHVGAGLVVDEGQ